ncbi:hypothetical protein CRUP_031774 [Coryphaenoides rupestris]|nr:hypothetical protein CRUP_031774 [Coryphaenoides rupestris]
MGEPESAVHGRVTIYSIQGCPHCVQAKATLGGLGVPVRNVDLGKHPELRTVVKELMGRSTVPQIFFNQVHVGGNDDLQKLDIDGQLRTAAEAFLENDDGCVVDPRRRELLHWVLEHMGDSPKRHSLQSLLSAGKTKVGYLPYDWSTNSTH